MELTTNGTVEVSDETLNALQEANVRVCISDYSEQFPNIKKKHRQLIGKLKKLKIPYTYMQEMKWVDFGLSDLDIKAKCDYITWHDSCNHPCMDFRNGILYSCSQAYWAKRRFPSLDLKQDELNLNDVKNKKEILEYVYGYNSNGYLKPCEICNGHTNLNKKEIEVAEQLEKLPQ